MPAPQPIDVFISRKSEDALLAKPLYDFLKSKGLRVFDSDQSLPELGNADYQRAIDHALESCEHMIVVGSSVENICSSWVDAEWRLFISEKRAGYKPGNILTVVSSGVTIRSLPASLRYYEVIPLEEKNYDRIYAYVKKRITTDTIQEEIRSSPLTPPIEQEFMQSGLLAKQLAEWKIESEKYHNNSDIYEAAQKGSAGAQMRLGIQFYYGNGESQSYNNAFEWFQLAAEQGLVMAFVFLGYCYQHGLGIKKSKEKAIFWLTKAADSGYESAKDSLAKLN